MILIMFSWEEKGFIPLPRILIVFSWENKGFHSFTDDIDRV